MNEIPVIEPYTPWERMNMLRSGARVRRLKKLIKLMWEGYDKVINNYKVEPIDRVIKRTQRACSVRELWEM
jgi:hypothetical protein